jgi:hypothetical protein
MIVTVCPSLSCDPSQSQLPHDQRCTFHVRVHARELERQARDLQHSFDFPLSSMVSFIETQLPSDLSMHHVFDTFWHLPVWICFYKVKCCD